jgi:hypothetical protein
MTGGRTAATIAATAGTIAATGAEVGSAMTGTGSIGLVDLIRRPASGGVEGEVDSGRRIDPPAVGTLFRSGSRAC